MPHFIMLIIDWAFVIFNLKTKIEAKEFFEKAIKIKPDYAEGLTNYGFILQKLKNYSLASVQFEKALKITSRNDEALLNLSKMLF